MPGAEGPGFGGFGAGGFGGFSDIFGDIFSDFFGTGARPGRPRQGERGADLQYNLELSFEQAAFGFGTEISLPRLEECDQCGGTGARSSKDIEVCPVCQGSGQQRIQQGFFSVSTTCNRCHGAGRIVRAPCAKCHGQGRIRASRKIKVTIPPGVDNGTRLKLTGEGEAGRGGGPPGDLYIAIGVRPHPLFRREDYDVYCEVPVSLVQAALGGEIVVPTLDGKVELKIPPGTQSGRHFRLRGKGIAQMRGSGRGDQYVEVIVETPTNLSERQKELLRDFEREEHRLKNADANYPIMHKFLDKLRELFG
jgi:molecular chaperone DnaJ